MLRRGLLAIPLLLAACATAPTPDPSSPATPEPTSAVSPEPTSSPGYSVTARVAVHISCFGVNLAGQDVRVSDESGALVAVATIDERTGEGPWTVEFEVPPAPFYTVEVGTNDTEDQAFTEAEMAEGDLLLVANPPDC